MIKKNFMFFVVELWESEGCLSWAGELERVEGVADSLASFVFVRDQKKKPHEWSVGRKRRSEAKLSSQ